MTKPIKIFLAITLFFAIYSSYTEFAAYQDRIVRDRINTKLCPNTEYQVINDVTYCLYKKRWVKPKSYVRLIK